MEIGYEKTDRLWHVEFDEAIKKLIDTHGSKLAVFYSGGFDSEILVRTLVKHGVQPELHTILFSRGENHEEVQHTFALADELGLKHITYNHDVREFVASGMAEAMGDWLQCSQLAYLTVVHYARELDVPVLMGGEIYVQKHQRSGEQIFTEPEWQYIYREDEDGMTYRYSHLTGHPVINEVFTYTPTMLDAWLKIPYVQSIISGEEHGKLSLVNSKQIIFRQAWRGQKLYANKKMHGYELLSWTNEAFKSHMKHRLLTQQVFTLPVKAESIDLPSFIEV